MDLKNNILEDELKISTSRGTLRGTTYTSEFNQQQYCAFLGIPYAKPPLNELRFMPPMPGEKWKGVLDATREGDPCIHFCGFKRYIIGSEDCLYLNIYTTMPPCRITSPKAVIVQIHGGGNNWSSGSSNSLGAPDYIVHHDVIFVSFNFRLHVLGFLNLNLPNCAGNMGLKDQVMALRWVKENIKYFGGDEDNITLYGSSAGATDVHLHMMSPLSKGLFHKVIMQGGYALNPAWSLMANPLERAFEYSKMVGFPGNNTKRLLLHLKNKSAQELVHSVNILRSSFRQRSKVMPQAIHFRPSVEMFPENAFLAHHPRALLQSVIPLPMLVNLCQSEGSNAISIDILTTTSKDLPNIVEENLFMYKINPEILPDVTNKIQSFYFGEETNYRNVPMQVLKLYMDMWTCEWQKMVDFQAKVAPVFVYYFTFEGKFNYQKSFFIRPFCTPEIDKEMGSCHSDDSSYFTHYKMINKLFKIPAMFKPKEIKVINNMAAMHTNFAKNGNPNENLSENVEWRAHTAENPCYLKFDLNLKVINGIINEERVRFWKDLIDYIKQHEPLEKSLE